MLVQPPHVVRDLGLLQQARQELGLLDGGRADEDGLALLVRLADGLDDVNDNLDLDENNLAIFTAGFSWIGVSGAVMVTAMMTVSMK